MTADQPYTPSLDEARTVYRTAAREFFDGRDPDGQFDRMIEAVRAEERKKAAEIVEGYRRLDPQEHAGMRALADRIREGKP
jgi:hypothetical protein